MSWRRLLGVTGILDAIVLALVGATKGDREALAIAVLVAVATLFLFRRWPGSALAAPVVLGLLFLDVSFWMVTAALSNIAAHQQVLAILEPVVLSAVSLAGLVAAVASIVTRAEPQAGGVPATAVGLLGVVVLLAGVVAAALSASSGTAAAAGDLNLRIHSAAYSMTRLTAPSEQVSISLTNSDLFWHTFTINSLGVDVVIPVDSHQRVTFHAPPGTYTFYCRIAGHRQAGMQGTLTVP